MARRRVLPGLLAAVALLIAATPAPASSGREMRIFPDISYAATVGRGHLLDLYLPGRRTANRRPLLIVMGGSGWFGDDGKAYAQSLAPFFTAAGFVVAGVSTRSSRQARFPAQVHDVKAAIRWLRKHAAGFGIDPRRVAVLGDSSGGWTAAMAGLTGPAFEGRVGVGGYPSDVQAVVDLYGPTDFAQMDAHMLPGACDELNRNFGLTTCHADPRSPESSLLGCPILTCPSAVQRANPITYVAKHAPPFLIAHGEEDRLVPLHQSRLLFDALHAAGAPATFYSVPGAGHDKSIVSPSHAVATVRRTAAGREAAPGTGRPTLETVDRFLRQALGL
ncbi:alpha/beta hydrolase fold domain-containing protein [Actinoplanes sp. CA-030573]|uniref:alpha/beta hydrolase fold domain-containing protein n=1 Tax=Actinoplanes sp. CA-030573 TaxID=3239898 RepID=UPI003D911E3A